MTIERVREVVQSNLQFEFARSGGAGGQNVNKVNTKAVARLPVSALEALGPEAVALVRERLSSRINRSDELVVHADEERTQLRNRTVAEDRIVRLILQAVRRQKPRRQTSVPHSAQRRRRHNKELQSRRKSERSRPGFDD